MKKHTVFTSIAVMGAVSVLAGCSNSSQPELRKQPNVELIQDMMDQPALKAQDYEPFDTKKSASRLPPENTVPVGYQPYKYHMDPAGAAANLKNPLAGNVESLKIGRAKYETYCLVCHGEKGAGDGPVAPKMALKPPPVISEKIIGINDGAIYHIITDGQGVMASYFYQIPEEKDRWALVNYIRQMQRQAKGGVASAQ